MASTGTFFSGALTAGASSYSLFITAAAGVTVLIDNIAVSRLNVTTSTTVPRSWARLNRLPFPRLGKYQIGSAAYIAEAAPGEGVPYTYTIQQVESGLAFNDVVVGLAANSQSLDPASIQRLRNLNPNIVILPYRIPEEDPNNASNVADANVDVDAEFYQGLSSQWLVRTTEGNIVYQTDFPTSSMPNISSFCALVSGETYLTYLQNWFNTQLFPSGIWDGVFLDNLFGRIDGHIPNASSPANLDYDWNRNGIRDETLASTNDMSRAAGASIPQSIQSANPGMQLIVGNTGPQPEIAFAPYVNGYVFECFNRNWYDLTSANPMYSQEGWRWVFDAYRIMQLNSLQPHINILEGCGGGPDSIGEAAANGQHKQYLTPTALDIQTNRFGVGTALLNDGFYSYDLFDNQSAPYWFDEDSVNPQGVATDEPTDKGYLGQALTDAVELTSPGAAVFTANFDSGPLTTFTGSPASGVSISTVPGQVISGTGSLVIENPNFTEESSTIAASLPNAIPFSPGNYLVQFSWKVLQTLDLPLQATVTGSGLTVADYNTQGVVTGDSGTANVPVSMPGTGGPWQLNFVLPAGGSIAIDNVQVVPGGVGPWRRDFEHGFVLVNPFSQPHTFSQADIAGTLNRTGVRRINGTQAPDINNGQAVTAGLTLGAFDAIILLADPICAQLGNKDATGTFSDLTREGPPCRVAPPFRPSPRR